MRPRIIWLLQDAGLEPLAYLVPTYSVMLGLAALLGAWLVVVRGRPRGLAAGEALWVMAWAFVAALAGAGAVPWLQAGLTWLGGGPFGLRSGMVAYGGLVGGTLVGVFLARHRKVPVGLLLDLVAPALGLGVFVTRIGCFLAGCDYGVPSLAFWAVRFPAGSPAFRAHLQAGWIGPDAHNSLPVVPTQLLHALCGLVLFGAVLVLGRFLPAGRGRLFAAFALGYAFLRFWVEFLRGDAGRGVLGPLSTSQWIGLVVLVGVGVWWWVRGRGVNGASSP